MAPKARVQKRLYYKIGEACKELDIQPYVLRYWETEFPALSPSKSRSGQRVYSEKELEVIRRIKELLYEEGYTIAGAKKKLETELASGAVARPPAGDPDDEPHEPAPGSALESENAGPEPAAAAQAAAQPDLASPPVDLPTFPPPPSMSPDRPGQQPLLLDTRAAERIQSMRQGIQEALEEAREILALLDAGSPSRR